MPRRTQHRGATVGARDGSAAFAAQAAAVHCPVAQAHQQMPYYLPRLPGCVALPPPLFATPAPLYPMHGMVYPQQCPEWKPPPHLEVGKAVVSTRSPVSSLSTSPTISPAPSQTSLSHGPTVLRATAPSFVPESGKTTASTRSPTASLTTSPTISPTPSQTSLSRVPGALRATAPSFEPGACSSSSSSSSEGGDDLPAVISVKKSHRGCAIVRLRDREVVERGAKQAVAVVDGVCVEVRRHTARHAADEDGEVLGLFVAWGYRVERKVTVTEAGLEAYFNALAKLPLPAGLEVRPPFEEACLCFEISSTASRGPALKAKVAADRAEREQLLGNATCGPDLVEHLWQAKGRLDDLWNIPPPPLARSLMSRVARSQLFPHSGEGGKEHENRAGDKLAELSAHVGLLKDLPRGCAFLDLCGGPGAWSQHLLQHGSGLRGFGFTLRMDAGDSGDWQAEAKDQWYPELFRDPRWTALWGADGSGDLLKLGNIEHAAKRLAQERVMLVAADGGFSDKHIPANLLELYFYRLLLAEVLMASMCLREDGRFVCKLYTTFSPATSSLLYLLTRMFKRVEVVKPKSSRVTGPERYLACFGFKANSKETGAVRAALMRSHEAGLGESPLTAPLLEPCVAGSTLSRDAVFQKSVRKMSETLCERQAAALTAVVDRAEFLESMAMSVAQSAGGSETPEFKTDTEPRRSGSTFRKEVVSKMGNESFSRGGVRGR